MPNRPSVSDLARKEWAGLLSAGISPTLDETAAFLFWAERVEHPDGQTSILLADARAVAGSETLRALSVQAEIWLEWIGSWADSALMLYSTAFAAAVGRERGAFADLTTRERATAAVENWARGLTCTEAELAAAVEAILPTAKPSAQFRDDDDTASASMRDILAELGIETGRDAEWWLTHTSDELLRALRVVRRRQVEAQGGHFRVPDASADAMREFLAVIEQIRRDHGKA